jgi:uncharacterized membrane protein
MADYNHVPVLALAIDPSLFWPYAAGAAILVIGVPVVLLGAARRARGFDKLAAFGPVLFGVAMAVFGADHYVGAEFVATVVPSWMPWHLFWTYFVGTALFAGALSFATTIQWRLAAASFFLMLVIFELTIHVPNLAKAPDSKVRLILVLREMSLFAGCLAFAASRSRGAVTVARKRLIAVACFLLAIPIGVFGICHFLDPTFAPGIPRENPTLTISMPSWLPAHVAWAYLTGAVFVVSAIALMIRRYAGTAALAIGATNLVLIVLVYTPLTISKATDIAGGLNYLAIHFALAGSALMLASALPSHSAVSVGEPGMAPREIGRVATP